ncbi:MAG: aminopeptidase P family protein [Alphaproteobacteria bacterium]|nr:aminopeptidase P family protein [Alphaproteobacteria bacterium]
MRDWLAGEGARLGYDPWLHTPDSVEVLKRTGATMVACDDNPLDAVWTDRPPPPIAPVRPHSLGFAGQSSAEKRAKIAADLAKDRIDAAVLTAPDAVAWLLDIRGGDVPFTPLALGFALIHADASVDLFMDRRKFTPGLDAHLGGSVRARDPEELGVALDTLAGRVVRIDPAGTAAWIVDRLERAGARIERGGDPCALPKAIKNPIELAGMRAAHRRDGAALVRFLAWLSRAAPGVGEIEASDRLLAFRRGGERFQGPSFPTISGAGPHGAIVHYHATPRTDRRLEEGMLYLVDSGGQYLDGTTDVTRTLAIGAPGAEERHRFTLVLKGHIALATARFPVGTTGSQLDAFARRALWDEGLDYDHGTGHGVGSFLGVHEGPQRIAKLGNRVALAPGMILSNEPGYYQTGAYGIRIENLVAVVERPPGLGFETLTLAPIDRTLVQADLLTAAERGWLDAYHARVFDEIGPLVDADTRAWLWSATRPVG